MIPLTCLYVSFVLLTIFAIKNVRIPGFPVILVGIALNFTVIGLEPGDAGRRTGARGVGAGTVPR